MDTAQDQDLAEAVLKVVDEHNTVYQRDIDDDGTQKTAKPTVGGDDDVVVLGSKRILIDVVLMESIYGAGHRGATAKQDFQIRDVIQVEDAAAYVTFDTKGANYFTRGRDVIPDCLREVKGGLLIALTGILIRDCEELALFTIAEGSWSLHGHLDTVKYATPYEAFPIVQDMYVDKEKAERWNLQTFGRLYAVVQRNATLSYIPLTTNVYGAGFFPGSVFFNHSCVPNAILVTMPGKCVVQVKKRKGKNRACV